MSQQKEIGTLVVVVLKAQHLHQPSFYKQDPYAQVSLSGLAKRTKVDQKGGQHPVWDDEFRFPVLADAGKDSVNRILEVSCYKDEQRGDDILLGKGTVDIEGTLKTGEFDDWIPLETSAGARGEIYLEMTFYANSPPPLTRRPTKLSPSDRLARPGAYYTQARKSTSPISYPWPSGSPATRERKPSQSAQIPSSLVPAHGPQGQGQASKQAPSNVVSTSAVASKHRDDSLPPLPDDDEPPDAGSGRIPVSLHPGGHSGPRPMPPLNRNRVLSAGRSPPAILPDQLHRSLSDPPVPLAASPLSFSHLQTPLQSYPPGARVDLPSIVVVEDVQDHPPVSFPTPLSPPLGTTHEHEPRGVYGVGDSDSFTYGPPGPVYAQSGSQAYMPQGYPQTLSLSPSPSPMPLQSPHAPAGQSQQPHDAYPLRTLPQSHYQQYTQYSSGSPAPLPLSPLQTNPQLQSTQSQQAPYPSQPPQPPHQQPYLPPQKQQYLPQAQQQHYPQHPPYAQTPHPPQASQPYQQYQPQGLPPNNQSPSAPPPPPPPPPPYSQVTPQPQQPYFTASPPLPSFQSQSPQPYASQPPPQSQSYFTPPPPPPPPPPLLHSQGGQGSSIPAPTAQPSQTPALTQGPTPPITSLPQSVPLVPPLRQSPTATPLPYQGAPNIVHVVRTEDVVDRVGERRNEAESFATPKPENALQNEAREDITEDSATEERSTKVVEGEREQLGDAEEQSVGEEPKDQKEDRQRCEEELRKQEASREEELLRQQEAECRRREEEERKKREEEQLRKQEEERLRVREEEERRKREEEELRRKEEEERVRREEEERKRKEKEERRREELRRRGEEHKRREEEERREREEECKRREEDVRQKREEEHNRQEEGRLRHEREEAERRRQEAEEQIRRRRAEEAEAERRWQEELVRIRARAEQEAADAAFARAQVEAEEAERRKQEEEDLALVLQAQEEAEREERLAQERRRQEEADMEVAKREQAHEEELERRRREERRKRMEEADRELAKRLDMELNLGAESPSNPSQRRRGAGSGGH